MKILHAHFILLSFLSFFGCNSQLKKSTNKANSETTQPKNLNPICYYSNYAAAMGSGKGVLFKIQIETESVLAVDSAIIGGKQMNFTVSKNKLTTIEINYFINKPEPNETNLNPKIPADPIIDQQAFSPSYLVIRTDKQTTEKVPITQFIKTKN